MDASRMKKGFNTRKVSPVRTTVLVAPTKTIFPVSSPFKRKRVLKPQKGNTYAAKYSQ